MQNTRIKKILVPIAFITIITIIFCIPLYKDSILRGDDLFFHLSRINGINDAFNDGQIIPRIYPYTNDGFGYASPLFYCDIFLIPAALFYHFGLSLIVSYKIELFIIVMLTSITIFFVSHKIFNNKYAPYLTTIFYVFCNYHIADSYTRCALGETLSFIFIPLVLLGTYYLLYTKEKSWLYLSIGFTGLLLSHNISFAIVLFFFVIMLLINIKKLMNKEKIILLCKATALSVGLVSFFLFPMIEQMIGRDYFFNHVSDFRNLKEMALPIEDLLFPFSLLKSSISEESNTLLSMGFILTFFPLTIFFFYAKKKNDNMYKFILTLTIVNYIFLFGTTNIFPFQLIPFLEVIQFPWRFFEITTILSCISLTYIIVNIGNIKYNKIISATLITFFMFGSFLHIFDINRIHSTDSIINDNLSYNQLKTDYNPYTLVYGCNSSEIADAEYLPYTVDMNYRDWSDGCIKYDNLDKAYCNYNRNGTTVTLSVNEEYSDISLLFPMTYYKGYQVYLVDENGSYIPVGTEENPFFGVIMFNIGSNTKATYQLIYVGTSIQKLSTIISFISLITLLLYKPLKSIRKAK